MLLASGIFFTAFVFSSYSDVKVPILYSMPVPANSSSAAACPRTQFEFMSLALEQAEEKVSEFSIGFAVIAFCFISVAAESLALWPIYEEKWDRVATFRFCEYSITASLMLVVIAVQIGIWDWRTLLCIFGLSATCMLCGLIGEQCVYSANLKPIPDARNIAKLAFGIGTLAVLLAWVPIFVTVARNEAVPKGVQAIIAAEFALWFCFAIVQFVQIWEWPKWLHDRVRAQEDGARAYLILSAVSKTALAWFTFSVVIANP